MGIELERVAAKIEKTEIELKSGWLVTNVWKWLSGQKKTLIEEKKTLVEEKKALFEKNNLLLQLELHNGEKSCSNIIFQFCIFNFGFLFVSAAAGRSMGSTDGNLAFFILRSLLSYSLFFRIN